MEEKRVVVGIIKKDGKYLMLKHNKCKGLYLFPSGKVEEGETVYQAIVRELNEEIGIEVKESSAIQIFTDTPSWYDRVDGIMLTKETVFFIDSYKGEPYNKEPNKHEEMVWVTPEEVFSNPKLYTYITYILIHSMAIDIPELTGKEVMSSIMEV